MVNLASQGNEIDIVSATSIGDEGGDGIADDSWTDMGVWNLYWFHIAHGRWGNRTNTYRTI